MLRDIMAVHERCFSIFKRGLRKLRPDFTFHVDRHCSSGLILHPGNDIHTAGISPLKIIASGKNHAAVAACLRAHINSGTFCTDCRGTCQQHAYNEKRKFDHPCFLHNNSHNNFHNNFLFYCLGASISFYTRKVMLTPRDCFFNFQSAR